MRTPLGKADDVGRRPGRQNVDDGLAVVGRCDCVVDEFDDPRVDTTTIQFDTDDGADVDRTVSIGNDVVEGLVDPADIGDDANDARQSLSAAFSASRRLSCSQVNSGRLRPK